MTPHRSACCGRAGSRSPGPTSRNSSPSPPPFPQLLTPLTSDGSVRRTTTALRPPPVARGQFCCRCCLSITDGAVEREKVERETCASSAFFLERPERPNLNNLKRSFSL